MILVIQENQDIYEITESVTLVLEMSDWTVQGDKIPASIGTAAGQIAVFNGTTWTVIAAPTANNQTLISDLTLATLWKIGSAGGGGTITLTNRDATTASVGSVAIADLANDTSFKSTTVPGHLGVVGVTAESINASATGKINIAGLGDVLVTGNVARGEWLIASSTAWRAKTAGYDRPLYGSIGYALTAYAGGGNGTVQAVVQPDPRHLTTAGTGWALGGYITAAQTQAQKFTVASATWSSVSGAALGSAAAAQAGLAYGTTAGYSMGGGDSAVAGTAPTVTAYKMPFSTETTAAQSSANLPAAKTLMRSGYNGSDRGYVVGGYNAANLATVTKLTYSTDTMSAALGTTLSAARQYPLGLSDGSFAYAQGGVSTVSDKITFSTDTVSDNNSGDVTSDSYAGVSFQADAGYMAEKSGATNNSKKIVFSTGVSSNVTSTLPADQNHAAGITDGSGLAWLSGDDGSPYSVSHKFTKATETYASDAGAVMAVGKMSPAYFNNGAY